MVAAANGAHGSGRPGVPVTRPRFAATGHFDLSEMEALSRCHAASDVRAQRLRRRRARPPSLVDHAMREPTRRMTVPVTRSQPPETIRWSTSSYVRPSARLSRGDGPVLAFGQGVELVGEVRGFPGGRLRSRGSAVEASGPGRRCHPATPPELAPISVPWHRNREPERAQGDRARRVVGAPGAGGRRRGEWVGSDDGRTVRRAAELGVRAGLRGHREQGRWPRRWRGGSPAAQDHRDHGPGLDRRPAVEARHRLRHRRPGHAHRGSGP